MSEGATEVSQRLQRYLLEFGTDIFSIEGDVLKCDLCKKIMNTSKKYYVQQHVRSLGHERLFRQREENAPSENLGTLVLSQRESSFSMDLCRMLVETNIPLFKVQHQSLRNFIRKYAQQDLPDHTTLRRTYLRKLYDDAIYKIRFTIGDDRIWVSIDETTDAKGQFVVNTVIGSLSPEKPTTPFLINSAIVTRTNHATIAQAFIDSLNLLWPDGIHHDRVLLFLTDAAPYMKKAGGALKLIFDKMIHLTCLLHGIHRICEEIRVLFPNVDSLIANVKKTFLKAPSRVQIFRSLAPNIALPPRPTVTRWGTWIEAALYYAHHFEAVHNVVRQLDDSDAASISKSQALMREPALRSNLAFIESNFSGFPRYITELECSAQLLTVSLSILRNVELCINSAAGPKAALIKEKFERVMQQNSDLNLLLQVEHILTGEGSGAGLPEWSVADIASFKYAPITSVDVERSFSRYKGLMTDRRHSLTPENAKLHLIPMCNLFEWDSV